MYQRYQTHCKGQERWITTRNKWHAIRHFTLLNVEVSLPPGTSLLMDDVHSWATSFQNVMRSEIGRQIFTKFLETEYSDENMMFWNACEDLKKEESYVKRRNMARDIYEMFIGPSAPLEVNLDGRVKVELMKRLGTNRNDPSMFDQAQDGIFRLMERDCYRRFTRSKVYRDFVANVELSTSANHHHSGGGGGGVGHGAGSRGHAGGGGGHAHGHGHGHGPHHHGPPPTTGQPHRKK